MKGFDPRSVHAGFVVDKVAHGQTFFPVHRFSPVSIIPPTHRALSHNFSNRQRRQTRQFAPSCEQATRHLMKTKEPSKRCQYTNAKCCENPFEQRLISAGCDDNSGVSTWTHEEGSTVRARNSACCSTSSQQHQQHQQPFPVPNRCEIVCAR